MNYRVVVVAVIWLVFSLVTSVSRVRNSESAHTTQETYLVTDSAWSTLYGSEARSGDGQIDELFDDGLIIVIRSDTALRVNETSGPKAHVGVIGGPSDGVEGWMVSDHLRRDAGQ